MPYSACVVNIISYKNAVSLYPRATFEERRALVCPNGRSEQELAVEKYSARGWDMLRVLPESERTRLNPSFRLGPRWLEDSDSWIIPLDMAGVEPLPVISPISAPIKQDPVTVTTWELSLTEEFGGQMEFFYLSHPTGLFYEYLIGDAEIYLFIKRVIALRIDAHRVATSTSSSSNHKHFDASVLTICTALLREQQLVGLRP
ncbi:hypothetical protein SCP_0214040 [Sparassis crispa]|uniref:Uncharacterized protein n=1 Tax=Sparassis crispa TaxID=139825 RepID=A0A401GDD5_9APHY|nr:hypothetical protein SCP_0214040 [Sparassis crispa]GBE80194.1 hypothetical protein SCP_0214040 [Sparassis crispa]